MFSVKQEPMSSNGLLCEMWNPMGPVWTGVWSFISFIC